MQEETFVLTSIRGYGPSLFSLKDYDVPSPGEGGASQSVSPSGSDRNGPVYPWHPTLPGILTPPPSPVRQLYPLRLSGPPQGQGPSHGSGPYFRDLGRPWSRPRDWGSGRNEAHLSTGSPRRVYDCRSETFLCLKVSFGRRKTGRVGTRVPLQKTVIFAYK